MQSRDSPSPSRAENGDPGLERSEYLRTRIKHCTKSSKSVHAEQEGPTSSPSLLPECWSSSHNPQTSDTFPGRLPGPPTLHTLSVHRDPTRNGPSTHANLPGRCGVSSFSFFFFAPHSEIQQHNYFRKACNIKVKRPKQEDTSEGLQGDRNNARSKRELLIYKIHGIPDIKEYIISLKKEQNIPFQTEHIQRTRKSFQKLKIH